MFNALVCNAKNDINKKNTLKELEKHFDFN